jgi:hypothetical protein
MRFLLHSMVAATMLIAISAIGSKAEAAMMPSIGTLPAQTKTYTPVEKVYYRIAVGITAMDVHTMAMDIGPTTATAIGHMVIMAGGQA